MDFHDIPITDIKYLLNYYGQQLSTNLYEQALNFITNNPDLPMIENVEDWIIAYNLIQEGNNIPTMSPFDIITSKNKILNLPDEKIINVLRYLHKLDDVNPFENLPDELIIKILSESSYDYNQLLLLCRLSLKFNKICNLYPNEIFRNVFRKEGYDFHNFDHRIMYNAIKLGTNRVKHIFNVENANIQNFEYINTEGQIYKLEYNMLDGTYSKTPFLSIKNTNIISFVKINKSLYLLDSFGNVYQSIDNIPQLIHKNIPQLIHKNIPQVIHKNIIKIVQYYFRELDEIVSLDINGNIFLGKYDEPVLKNIKNFFVSGSIIIFFDNNGTIYKLNTKDYKKYKDDYTFFTNNIIEISDLPKNIKDVTMTRLLTVIVTTAEGELLLKNMKRLGPIKKYSNNTYNIKINIFSEKILALSKDNVLSFINLSDGKITEKLYNVKDFFTIYDILLVLFNDGKLIYFQKTTKKELFIDGKDIKLISNDFLLIDGKLNYIVYHNETDEFNIVPL
jgi:hypothetical protein